MRFFKLWAVMVPVYLTLALLAIFAATAFAVVQEVNVEIPLLVTVHAEDEALGWQMSTAGLGLVILILPLLTAGVMSALGRNDNKADAP